MATTNPATSFDPTLANPIDPDFTLYWALNHTRPKETFYNIDYLRIGDSAFEISPSKIIVHEMTDNHAEDVLRTPGGIVMSNGFAEKEIIITLEFATSEEIFGLPNDYSLLIPAARSFLSGTTTPLANGYLGSPQINPNSLAALVAQFKRTPIVPVQNQLLNMGHNIKAVALEVMQIETKMDDEGKPVPNYLTATLVLKAFETQGLCPGLVDFDNAWIWPLARWHWRQAYAAFLPGEYRIIAVNGQAPRYPQLTSTEISSLQNVKPGDPPQIFYRYGFANPTGQGMTNDFQFLAIDQDWISGLEGLRNEYVKLLNYALSDEVRNSSTTTELQGILQDVQTLANEVIDAQGEQNANMVPVDLCKDGELILTHMSTIINNNFAKMRMPNQEVPVYQHMGQGDIKLQATFWATSESILASLRSMIREARDLSRNTRFEVVAGFIGFENEIASLMGVRNVVFTDMQVSSIDRLPGNYLITIEMIAFDRHQRRIEEIKRANGTPDTLIPQYITESKPDYTDPSDIRLKFWSRYFNLDANQAEYCPAEPSQIIDTTTQNQIKYDEKGRPVNAWYNMAYIQEAIEQMAYLELYPDLCLPTYERLQYAIQNEIFNSSVEIAAQAQNQTLRWTYWSQKGRYVDPDFYIDYPSQALSNQLQGAISNTISTTTGGLSLAANLTNAMNNVNLGVGAISGSLKEAVLSSLYDTYPAGGLYGPDPKTQLTPTGVETNEPRDNSFLHMTVGVPTPTQTTTSIAKSVFNIPQITEQNVVIDGTRVPTVVHPPSDFNWDTPTSNRMSYIGQTQVTTAYNQIIGNNPPGQDTRALLNQVFLTHHPVDLGSNTQSEYGRLWAMWGDMIEHDKTGRLVQAYPSYVFQIIDEGPRMGWAKIFSNFYALQAVQSIDVIQDRRDPIHTCIIELINSYGNLSNYTQGQINLNAAVITTQPESLIAHFGTAIGSLTGTNTTSITSDIQAWWDGLLQPIRNLLPSASVVEAAAALRRQANKAVLLQPGARIHVRMGYGSNGSTFPVAFNGRIVDIGHDEHTVIIAQGDGLELTKLVPTAEKDATTINQPDQSPAGNIATQTSNFFHGKGFQAQTIFVNSFEPRELILNLLNSQGQDMYQYGIGAKLWNSIKGFWYQSTNGAVFFDNPMGITHFGNPYLFNVWNAISGGTVDPLAVGNGGVNPQEVQAYNLAMKAFNPNNHGSFLEKAAALGSSIWSNIISTGDISSSLLGAGTGLTTPNTGISSIQTTANTLSIINPAAGALVSGLGPAFGQAFGWGAKIAGEAGTLLRHYIPVGFGETGENVYPIYSPFVEVCQNFGTVFNAATQAFQSTASANSQTNNLQQQLSNTSGLVNTIVGSVATNSQPTGNGAPNDLTPPSGPLMPGLGFNMFTHNKTAWDIIQTMAQYFPPYIASVRPFEYRSTLFFGQPYFQFRYGYDRINSYDLGGSDGSQDQYYGYPVAYHCKPFVQMHYYDSKCNLLDDTIRASDEDTYTDVIAMWYQGTTFSGGRPEPIPVHQTVDRSIGAMFKKTAIVNTDVVGGDVPPTATAIIGSGFTDLIPYAIAHGVNWIGNVVSVPGLADVWGTGESMRWMTRSILRDYQKLMYQGNILVIGDPTVKPHDWMWINDDYTDVTGLAGVRRVIHHFSLDTGFVTSIEPDLMTEVKGQNMLTSLKIQVAYIATSVFAYFGGRIALALGRRILLQAMYNVWQKFASAAKTAGNFASKIPGVSKLGLTINQKAAGLWRPSEAASFLRNQFIQSFASLLGANNVAGQATRSVSGIAQSDFQASVQLLQEAFATERQIYGANATQVLTESHVMAVVEKAIAQSAEKDGARLFDQVFLNAVKNNIAGTSVANLSQAIADTMVNVVAVRAGIRVVGQQARLPFGLGGSGTLSASQFIKNIASSLGNIASDSASLFRSLFSTEATEGIGIAAKTLAGTGIKAALTSALGSVELLFGVGTGGIGFVADAIFNVVIGLAFTAVDRYWDDETSLEMIFLKYRGEEFQAGLNGHSQAIVLRASASGDTQATLSQDDIIQMRNQGLIHVVKQFEEVQKIGGLAANSGVMGSPAQTQADLATANATASQFQGVLTTPPNATTPLNGKVYSQAEREVIISKHQAWTSTVTNDLLFVVNDSVIEFLNYLTSCNLSVLITAAAKNSHPTQDSAPTSGFGGHWVNQAIDVGGVKYITDTSMTIINSTISPQGISYIQACKGWANTFSIGVYEYYAAVGFTSNSTYSQAQITGVGGSIWAFIDSPAHIHVCMKN